MASGKSSLHASCEGPLRIPLQSVPGPRSSSGAEARTSGFLSSYDRDLRDSLVRPQESPVSMRVARDSSEVATVAEVLTWS